MLNALKCTWSFVLYEQKQTVASTTSFMKRHILRNTREHVDGNDKNKMNNNFNLIIHNYCGRFLCVSRVWCIILLVLICHWNARVAKCRHRSIVHWQTGRKKCQMKLSAKRQTDSESVFPMRRESKRMLVSPIWHLWNRSQRAAITIAIRTRYDLAVHRVFYAIKLSVEFEWNVLFGNELNGILLSSNILCDDDNDRRPTFQLNRMQRHGADSFRSHALFIGRNFNSMRWIIAHAKDWRRSDCNVWKMQQSHIPAYTR